MISEFSLFTRYILEMRTDHRGCILIRSYVNSITLTMPMLSIN